MQIDLAAEMAAARQRRAAQTAKALRDARVVAVRAAARPGATREDIADLARSFYPRLSDEQREELTCEVWDHPRGMPAPVVVPVDEESEEVAAESEELLAADAPAE